MKRLVGILTVLMLAVSVFALDVSAGIKFEADLLNYDGDDFRVLAVRNGTSQWNQGLTFSVGTEKAGGQFKIWPNGLVGNHSGWDWRVFNAIMGGWNLWFKPFDGMTVSLGNVGAGINEEQIDWYRSDAKAGDLWGASVSYGKNGFEAVAVVETGVIGNGDNSSGGYLRDPTEEEVKEALEKALKEGKSAEEAAEAAKAKKDTTPEKYFVNPNEVKPFYIQAGYGADFGRIAAFFKYNAKKDMKFGLGYNNTFGSTYMFVNGIFYMGEELNKVRGEIYVAPAIGPAGVKLWIPVDYDLKAEKDALNISAIAVVNLNLGAPVTPYLRIDTSNFLKDFGMTIKPGITGSVGAMGYDVGIACNVGEKFTFSVPVTCTLGF